MNWEWVLSGIGLVMASGLVMLAVIELVAAALDDGRTRWRVERAVYGVFYLGVAWFAVGGNPGIVVAAIALGVLWFMGLVR